MTRDEAIASLDESVMRLVGAYRDLGLVVGFVREVDADEFRLICPQHLMVAPLMRRAADHLDGARGGGAVN